MYDIKNDVLYSSLRKLSKNELYQYGWIDEQRSVVDEQAIQDYRILSLPILNIKSNDKFNDISINKKKAIIVTTGSFSPVHDGHIMAMELAKDYVQKLGYEVVQGVISLSHDIYVSVKNGGIAKQHVGNRTQQVYEKIKNIHWLTVDRFEGEFVSCPLNFSTVIERVKKYYEYHVHEKVKIFYVFGSDNKNFIHAFNNQQEYDCICIQRNFEDLVHLKEEFKNNQQIHFIDNKNESGGYSSTKIRNEQNIKKKSKVKNNDGNYIIRVDDIDPLFFQEFQAIIKKYIKNPLRIFKLNLNDFIHINNEPTQFISLDKEINKNIDKFKQKIYPLDVSRIFLLCDSQYKAIKISSVKGGLDEQIKKIPSGHYQLIDDDSITGYTIEQVKKELMKKDIHITGLELIVNKISDNIFDIIDAKDFYFDDEHGLAVSFLEKELRFPYIFPFVNLTQRASIEVNEQISFSLEILYLNQKYQKNKKKWRFVELLGYESNEEFMQKYIDFFENYLKISFEEYQND